MKELILLMDQLVTVYDAYHLQKETFANQGQALDGYSALANYDDLARQIKEELENL
jgi:hypothetical protein